MDKIWLCKKQIYIHVGKEGGGVIDLGMYDLGILATDTADLTPFTANRNQIDEHVSKKETREESSRG